MAHDPEFHTADGWLTLDALARNYIEQHEHLGIRTTLWLEGTLHVRQFDHMLHKRIFWDVFEPNDEQLIVARDRYRAARLNALCVWKGMATEDRLTALTGRDHSIDLAALMQGKVRRMYERESDNPEGV